MTVSCANSSGAQHVAGTGKRQSSGAMHLAF
jgi:hypothetical protein